jgi:hypothetical protein
MAVKAAKLSVNAAFVTSLSLFLVCILLQAEDRQLKDFQGDYDYYLTKNRTEAKKMAVKAAKVSVNVASVTSLSLLFCAFSAVPQAEDRQLKDFQGDYEYYLTKNETEAEKMAVKAAKVYLNVGFVTSLSLLFCAFFAGPQAEDRQLKDFQGDYE